MGVITTPCPKCGRKRTVIACGAKAIAGAKARVCMKCKNRHSGARVRATAEAGDSNRQAKAPPGPTKELPGSEAKMLVMRKRIAAGYAPHHPDDAKHED